MNSYQIKITFLSDVLIGSGEGYGTIIDTDSVFDDIGLPFIPAKRIKGILLESAQMLNNMLGKFDYNIPLSEIFGVVGEKEGNLNVNNFFLKDYENIYAWLYYLKKYPLINKQRITEQLVSLRYATAIDYTKNFAKEHSLRKERAIIKNMIFIGEVEFDEKYEKDIAIICQNIRRIGTKRNRGLGEVEVKLLKNSQEIFNEALLAGVLK